MMRACTCPSSAWTWCRPTASLEGAKPQLDRLGGTAWAARKSRVNKSLTDMADKLLELYAERKAAPGFAFSPDTPWQREFEDAFEFTETPDQTHGDRRHQARHGAPHADGPPALRRRGLRQNRSRHARGVQGRLRLQASRGAGAHHGPRVPALRNVSPAHGGVSRADRDAQPLPQRREQKKCSRPWKKGRWTS